MDAFHFITGTTQLMRTAERSSYRWPHSFYLRPHLPSSSSSPFIVIECGGRRLNWCVTLLLYLIVCPQRIITHFQHRFFPFFILKNERFYSRFRRFWGFSFLLGQSTEQNHCWKKGICSVVTFNSAAATQKSIYLAFVAVALIHDSDNSIVRRHRHRRRLTSLMVHAPRC